MDALSYHVASPQMIIELSAILGRQSLLQDRQVQQRLGTRGAREPGCISQQLHPIGIAE